MTGDSIEEETLPAFLVETWQPASVSPTTPTIYVFKPTGQRAVDFALWHEGVVRLVRFARASYHEPGDRKAVDELIEQLKPRFPAGAKFEYQLVLDDDKWATWMQPKSQQMPDQSAVRFTSNVLHRGFLNALTNPNPIPVSVSHFPQGLEE